MPRPPPPPPPLRSPPPPPPLPPLGSCWRWCDEHVSSLAWFAANPTMLSAGATGGGSRHALTFATHVATAAAAAGISLATLLNPSPPLPPPPPVQQNRPCFGPGFTYLPSCNCHPSCLSCGFSASPTTDADCIACPGGRLPTVVLDGPASNSAGAYLTGFCAPPPSTNDQELTYLCYDACAFETQPNAPPTPPTTAMCTDTCFWPSDGVCDDGSGGSTNAWCALGTDCTDCGIRGAPPAPPKEAPRAPPTPPSPPVPPPGLPPPSPPQDTGGAACVSATGVAGTAGCQPWCAGRAESTATGTDACGRCECRACAACAPSAPPPNLPPAPPGLVLIPSQHVEVMVTVAGSIYDYNITGRLEPMKAAFATAAGVPLSEVTLTLTGGSVSLLFSVDDVQPEAVSANLQQALGDAASASRVLLAPVVTAPSVAIVTTHTTGRAPALPPASPGTVYVQRVSTAFTLAGDVGSFDREGFRSSLMATFPSASRVTLTVTAASISVLAELDFTGKDAATAAATKINTTPVATMQSSWFASVRGGVSIENVPSASVAEVAVIPTSSSPPPAVPSPVLGGGPNLILIIGAGAGIGLVIGLIAALYLVHKHCTRKHAAPVALPPASVPQRVMRNDIARVTPNWGAPAVGVPV